MPVKINVDSRFWGGIEGKARIFEVEGKTVQECLRQLVEKDPSLKTTIFDGSGDLTAVCFLTINLAPLMVGRLEKEVKDGDVIGLVFGGGS